MSDTAGPMLAADGTPSENAEVWVHDIDYFAATHGISLSTEYQMDPDPSGDLTMKSVMTLRTCNNGECQKQ